MKTLYKTIPILLTILIAWNTSIAQRMPKLPKTREVVVNVKDTVIKASILIKKIRTPYKDSVVYAWYGNNKLNYSMNTFPKNPLHGLYTKYDGNKNLIAQGEYKKGLKCKRWIEWDSKGVMTAMYKYRKGRPSGRSKVLVNGTYEKKIYLFGKERKKHTISLKKFFSHIQLPSFENKEKDSDVKKVTEKGNMEERKPKEKKKQKEKKMQQKHKQNKKEEKTQDEKPKKLWQKSEK